MQLRILLLPFSIIYGLIIRFRNLFFDLGFFSSKSFSFPVITVGNLSTGGTGKTPHVAYLINLLRDRFQVATLSRGYGRSTSGFIIADMNSNAKQIGDEPMLYMHRFSKSILIGVGEKRVEAIEKMKEFQPQLQTIILDDAYQHRFVKAGLTILLTEYNHPFFSDYLLPAGNLREPTSGKKRADVIVVTKCPEDLNNEMRLAYKNKMQLGSKQQLYFSGFKYGNLISLKNNPALTESDLKDFEVLLVSGIANPEHIYYYLKGICSKVYLLSFADHYQYKVGDMQFIEKNFNTIASSKKIIVTTEKDAMRFHDEDLSPMINQLPFYYLPIEVYFFNESINFNQTILNYVAKN